MSPASNGEALIQWLAFFPRILSGSFSTYFLPLYNALREAIFLLSSKTFKCSREFLHSTSQNTLNYRVRIAVSYKKSLQIFLTVSEISIRVLVSLLFLHILLFLLGLLPWPFSFWKPFSASFLFT